MARTFAYTYTFCAELFIAEGSDDLVSAQTKSCQWKGSLLHGELRSSASVLGVLSNGVMPRRVFSVTRLDCLSHIGNTQACAYACVWACMCHVCMNMYIFMCVYTHPHTYVYVCVCDLKLIIFFQREKKKRSNFYRKLCGCRFSSALGSVVTSIDLNCRTAEAISALR